MAPQVSIVVRSYNRVPALCELLPLLLAQDHDDFEIVVVEQSTRVDDADRARLAEFASDERVRVLEHPPLGGARARNVGVEAARGEFVFLIDDDDRPEDSRWIAGHLANYDDPSCLGVSGRQRYYPGEDNPYRFKRIAHWRCQRFSPLLKLPWVFVRQDRRKVPIDSIHGTNSSIRKQAFERFGGWDVDTRIEDEASFAYRAGQLKQPHEYFAFDPIPVVVRGLDVPGGLDKRYLTPARYFEKFMEFVHNIIGRYFPWRVRLLYPLYVLAVTGWSIIWIWDDSQIHGTVLRRILGTLAFIPTVPYHTARCLIRRWRAPAVEPEGPRSAR